jgi:hypothetical protein
VSLAPPRPHLVLLLIVAGLLPRQLHAAGPAARTRAELARHAQVIALGRCTAMRCSWNAEHTVISTEAVYDVEEAVTGAKRGEQLVVKALGGSVGNISQMVVGGPRFELGARDLLFLVAGDEPGTLCPVGLAAGRVRVAIDPGSGEDVVVGESGVPCGPPRKTAAAPADREDAPAESVRAVLEELRRHRQTSSTRR